MGLEDMLICTQRSWGQETSHCKFSWIFNRKGNRRGFVFGRE